MKRQPWLIESPFVFADEKKKGIQTSAIIGAAIGGVLLVFGAAGFAFAIFKKTATWVLLSLFDVFLTITSTKDYTIYV